MNICRRKEKDATPLFPKQNMVRSKNDDTFSLYAFSVWSLSACHCSALSFLMKTLLSLLGYMFNLLIHFCYDLSIVEGYFQYHAVLGM